MPSVTARDTAPTVAAETLLELRFAARADRLKLMRGAVRDAARMCGLSDTAAQDAVLAVDEACQNIVVHAYGGRGDDEIVLTLARRDDGLFVQIRDFGPLVDPSKISHRALDDVKPGQLGSYFIKSIMDRVEFHPAPGGGNLLHMFKRKDDSK